jgi:hypothetical protein
VNEYIDYLGLSSTHQSLLAQLGNTSLGSLLDLNQSKLPKIKLRYLLLSLDKGELNVARRGHVGVDSAVGTVCASTLLGSLVDLELVSCF